MRQLPLWLTLAAVSANLTTATETKSQSSITPNHDSAKENSNLIFNALHSAGRQWGSSVYHNGFGFFPAQVPRGTLFYHGTSRNETPTEPEWLAFEIEHAENFARSSRTPAGTPSLVLLDNDEPSEQVLTTNEVRPGELLHQQSVNPDSKHGPGHQPERRDDMVNHRGYLHTYQADRDLKLLLIDGMSAGKTNMGTLDSQDLVLRENSTNVGFDEEPRAADLCKLVTEWGYDGLVRMEVGFEVIHCDFHKGLDRIAIKRTMLQEHMVGNNSRSIFRWARAATERYDGVGDRLRIDFSSMVSGLFFPINISSIDADRPDLKRLAASSLSEWLVIKAHLKQVATAPRRYTVNWQTTVDLIVTRFAKPLRSMAYDKLSMRYFIEEVEAATLFWVDAPAHPDDVTVAGQGQAKKEAIADCRAHFLLPSRLSRNEWSLEDDLIHTSIDAVIGDICTSLFSIRDLLLRASAATSNGYRVGRAGDVKSQENMSRAVEKGRVMVQELMERLGWSVWKQLQPCGPDKMLFIAMWPFGGAEDHWEPGCKSADELAKWPMDSYWKLGWK